MDVALMIKVLAGFFLIHGPAWVLSQEYSAERQQISILRPAVERVFVRKKRWMIFPKGSNLKFTINVSKRLLAMYPKGFSFNLEAAIYYPMPTARMDVIPSRFQKFTKKTEASKGARPLQLVGIPGSLIAYRARPATVPAKMLRVDKYISRGQSAVSPSYNSYSNAAKKWQNFSSSEYLTHYPWALETRKGFTDKYAKYINKLVSKPNTTSFIHPPSPHYKWKYRPLVNREGNKINAHNSIFEEQEAAHKPIYLKELEPFEDTPHYYSYRSRRELFHHFEGFSKILGVDMRSCVLRAICDTKRRLLPPGYSMIQDIIRVVFTFPTIHGLADDYTRIMRADYRTCDAHIRNKCPFSILDWLLNSNKLP